jgi:hypothetical protein
MGRALEELERPKAKDRQKLSAGRGQKRCGQISHLNDTGKTRDKVGEAIGMSGVTYQRAKAAATRWCEVRIGELLGKAECTQGKRTDLSPESDKLNGSAKDDRYKFRRLAQHKDLVAKLIDGRPGSRPDPSALVRTHPGGPFFNGVDISASRWQIDGRRHSAGRALEPAQGHFDVLHQGHRGR